MIETARPARGDRRARTRLLRRRRRGLSLVLTGVLSGALSGMVTTPAGAMPVRADGPAGFAMTATATPLKIEVYEPAIPIPADPQLELSLSYSTVEAATGPSSRARASTLWPGDPVGEGLTTIISQAGLPPQLGANGYPVQANAQSPGTPSHAAQEPLPGMVSRADADDKSAVAQSGYDSDANIEEAPAANGKQGSSQSSGPGDGPGGLPLPDPADLLGGLSGAPTGAPTSTGAGGAGAAATPSPLGALSAIVDAGTASSISRTAYGSQTVVATSTSRLGEVKLLGGIIRLGSITSTARTTSNLEGSRSTGGTTFSGMTIAGVPFELTDKGVRAAGQPVPIPGLPDDPTKALAALGVSISLPQPEVTRDGLQSSIDVRGIVISVDTDALRSKLPSLPMNKLTAGLPDSAKQLKGLLLALNEAHPRVVIRLGNAASQAVSVPPVSFDFPQGANGGGAAPAAGGAGTSTPTTGSTAGAGGFGTAGGSVGATVPAGAAPAAPAADPVQVANVSSSPGLPRLGTVPGLLSLGGLVVAGVGGWWMRRAGLLALGGAAQCSHGLASGIPDLRKARP